MSELNPLTSEVIRITVNSMIGPATAIGETRHDNASFDRLKVKCELVDELMQEISLEAAKIDDSRASLSRSGKYAHEHLKHWHEDLTDTLAKEST